MPGNKVLVDNKKLKDICKRRVEWFWRKYDEHVIEDGGGRKCIYIDNGANVLAVAHLDTVIDVRETFNFNVYTRKNTRIIKCPALDDRLGVYIILEMLPALLGDGWADVLLTTDEESGSSTADVFVEMYKDEREYSWMVEFDRRGGALTKDDDAVLYNYSVNAKDFKEALQDAGFKDLSRGSFTDITDMEDMGVKAFNVAVGYHNNHSTKAYMLPIQTEYAVENFIEFYKANENTTFKHTKVAYKTYNAAAYRNYDRSSSVYDYDGRWQQSHMGYNLEPPLRVGLDAKGSGFKAGDIVYNRKYMPNGTAIYAIADVYEYAGSGYKYKLDTLDGVYSASLVEEEHLEMAKDVCSYCLKRNVTAWLYYDEFGVFFLCDMCRYLIMDGDAMCEDCLKTYTPDEYTSGTLWGSTCPACLRAEFLRPGDVVVFAVSSAEDEVKGVPFLITGHVGGNGSFALWDGATTYENDGKGYDTSWIRPIEYGVTMETFVTKYGPLTWGAKVKES